jgi:DUF1365 family protein
VSTPISSESARVTSPRRFARPETTGRWGGAAIYDTRIAHVRHTPVKNAFRYRSYSWLVDVDALPQPRWFLKPLAQFRAGDHFGQPDRTLRENVESLLWQHDVDLRGGRVRMLANARVLGYVFNPLSVYWCHDDRDELVAVIAEVHNTYGERHAYFLRPGADGRVEFDKQFYVSPFYPVDGSYVMSLPEPGEDVAITVELHRGEAKPFVATVRGRRTSASTGALLRAAARVPWVTLTVALQIRMQGIKLWARRVPVVPRPPHPRQPGV